MYDGLTDDGIAVLDKRARQLGNRMLQELNRLASEREEAEVTSTAPRRRFTCGMYFYSELAQGPDLIKEFRFRLAPWIEHRGSRQSTNVSSIGAAHASSSISPGHHSGIPFRAGSRSQRLSPDGRHAGHGHGRMMGRGFTSGSAWPTGLPLRQPRRAREHQPVADEFEGALVAAPYLASLVSGHTTELWGYNNAFPGPLIELREGQRVTIDFANRLGLDSTIHWHGLAVPPDQDGSPMDPVAPGQDRAYTFDVPMGSAGTYWYHPHAHRTDDAAGRSRTRGPADRAQRRRSAGDASRGDVDGHVAFARPERAGGHAAGSDGGHGRNDDGGRRRIAGERAEDCRCTR